MIKTHKKEKKTVILTSYGIDIENIKIGVDNGKEQIVEYMSTELISGIRNYHCE